MSDKVEITVADVGNIVRNLRALPAEDPQPVWVFDPVTGTWHIEWKIPDPHPLDERGRSVLDYATIPDESAASLDEVVESFRSSGKPADLLLASADLQWHAQLLGRRRWLYASMNRATSRRACYLVSKCRRDSSSCSRVELKLSAAALSRADPTGPSTG